MPKSRHPPRALISAAMAEFGRKGGKSGKGDSKRRGDSKFYSELIARRWAKKKGEPKPRKQRRRVLP